jgi:hypothetical protein
MRRIVCVFVSIFAAFSAASPAAAQTQVQPPAAAPPAGPLQILPPTISTDLRIVWEVKNRFRLFRREADFLRHVAAQSIKSVLAAEQIMAGETDGRGWARTMLGNLCIDAMGGVMTTCERDGARESYLAPADHRVEMRLVGTSPQNSCAWVFDEGDGAPRNYTGAMRRGSAHPPALRQDDQRHRRCQQSGRAAAARDGASRGARLTDCGAGRLHRGGRRQSGPAGHALGRRLLLPPLRHRQRVLSSRPRDLHGRPVLRNVATGDEPATRMDAAWRALDEPGLPPLALRLSGPHRAGAGDRNPHIAVTFLPLACTGATIDAGVLGSMRARELNCTPEKSCPSTVPAQVTQLQQYLATARRTRPGRNLDLVLLTVGANDIDFSGLVANVIIDSNRERVLFGSSVISSVENAESALASKLPGGFAKLRAALKPMVGGDLARVVFVSYGHPAARPDGSPCPGGQAGFDVHPSFKLDGERMRRVADFVGARFLPALKAIVQCAGGTICQIPRRPHDLRRRASAGVPRPRRVRALGAGSGVRPRLLSADGKSFASSPVAGRDEPLTCGAPRSDFRAYAPRARWIRTANDSYFVAMTYPEGLPATLQPTDIHDATWGVVSAVYGGAVHPTAEGHAAMADAALAASRQVGTRRRYIIGEHGAARAAAAAARDSVTGCSAQSVRGARRLARSPHRPCRAATCAEGARCAATASRNDEHVLLRIDPEIGAAGAPHCSRRTEPGVSATPVSLRTAKPRPNP